MGIYMQVIWVCCTVASVYIKVMRIHAKVAWVYIKNYMILYSLFMNLYRSYTGLYKTHSSRVDPRPTHMVTGVWPHATTTPPPQTPAHPMVPFGPQWCYLVPAWCYLVPRSPRLRAHGAIWYPEALVLGQMVPCGTQWCYLVPRGQCLRA